MTIKSDLKVTAISALVAIACSYGTYQSNSLGSKVMAKIVAREEQAHIKERDKLYNIYTIINGTSYELTYDVREGNDYIDLHLPNTTNTIKALDYLLQEVNDPLIPIPLQKNIELKVTELKSDLNNNLSIYDNYGNLRQFFEEREKLLRIRNSCQQYINQYTAEIKQIPTMNYIKKYSIIGGIMVLGMASLVSAGFSVLWGLGTYNDIRTSIKEYDEKHN
jgi:hypothetical protein